MNGIEDSFMLWLRDTFVCSNLNRMFVGKARWQKKPHQSGGVSSRGRGAYGFFGVL